MELDGWGRPMRVLLGLIGPFESRSARQCVFGERSFVSGRFWPSLHFVVASSSLCNPVSAHARREIGVYVPNISNTNVFNGSSKISE